MTTRAMLWGLAGPLFLLSSMQGRAASLARWTPPDALVFLEMKDPLSLMTLEGLGAASETDAGPLLRAASLLRGLVTTPGPGGGPPPFTGHTALIVGGVRPASPPVAGFRLPGVHKVAQCDVMLLAEHRGNEAQALEAADGFMGGFMRGAQRSDGVALGHPIHSLTEVTREPVTFKGKGRGQAQGAAPLVAERTLSSHWLANDHVLALFVGERPPSQRAVQTSMEGGQDTLAATSQFREALSALTPESQVLGFVNVAGLAQRIVPIYEGYRGYRPSALHLEEIRSAGFGAQIVPGGIQIQAVAWAPEPRQGLAALLFESLPLTGKALHAIPDNSQSWTATAMNWRRAWVMWNQLLGEFSPKLKATWDERVALVETVLTLSIADDLIPAMGPEAVEIELPARSDGSDGGGMALAWEILDASSFDAMAGRALQIAGALAGAQAERNEGPGMRLWSLTPAPGGALEAPPFAIGITQTVAVFSDSTASVMQSIQSGAAGADPLRQNGPLEPLLSSCPVPPSAAALISGEGGAPMSVAMGHSGDALHVTARIPIRLPGSVFGGRR